MAAKNNLIPALATQLMELTGLPSAIDGSAGSNRSLAAQRQITADNDVDALKAFLARYADTKSTFENYRKEVERLFLWSTGQLGKPVSSQRLDASGGCGSMATRAGG